VSNVSQEAPTIDSSAIEMNFDGIVGPTHNYAGLSVGNLASQQNAQQVSNPREAALQGLAKMKFLADLGVPQAVLPPHERPDVDALRRVGFSGSDAQVIDQAAKTDPTLLAAASSASAMWAANAATVSPSADTADGRVHFTPANLLTQFHRLLEPPTTAAILRAIFAHESVFAHHPPLPGAAHFSDEGAANHTRLCSAYGDPGLEIFVYGRDAFAAGAVASPTRFPARQTLQASAANARTHQLEPLDVLMLRQNPAAIDAGAFHNDVVAVGGLNVLLYHERAFADEVRAINAISQWFEARGDKFHPLCIAEGELPLSEAVSSYLFNSQIVQLPNQTLALIAPRECDRTGPRDCLSRVVTSGSPIGQVHFVDVRQSMRNGGGPACLRLRVVLTPREQARMNPNVVLTESLYQQLTPWVRRHYRDQLSPDDLRDPHLLDEGRTALDELSRILGVGNVYPFQR